MTAGLDAPSGALPSGSDTLKTNGSRSQLPHWHRLTELSADECMTERSDSDAAHSCNEDSLRHAYPPPECDSPKTSTADHEAMSRRQNYFPSSPTGKSKSECWRDKRSLVSASDTSRRSLSDDAMLSFCDDQMHTRSSSSMRTYVVGRGPDTTAMQNVARQLIAVNRTPSKRSGKGAAEALKERVLLRWALLHSMMLYKTALGITRV